MLSFASVKRSTPTEGLRIIYDIIPAHLFLEQIGLASYVRQHNYLLPLWRGVSGKKTYSTSHLCFWETLTIQAVVRVDSVDKIKVIF